MFYQTLLQFKKKNSDFKNAIFKIVFIEIVISNRPFGTLKSDCKPND